jgi:hypothetical protein
LEEKFKVEEKLKKFIRKKFNWEEKIKDLFNYLNFLNA